MSAKRAVAKADVRWETRLLLTITAIMVAFGIANTYSASSFVASGETGASFAVRQFTGAVVGGLLLSIVARIDYHIWRRWAWPLLGLTIAFLVVPLLPFTYEIAPLRNGARRWPPTASNLPGFSARCFASRSVNSRRKGGSVFKLRPNG